MQWSTGACLCAVLLLQLQGPVVDASFWDTIPVVSQVKSIAEWATGDKEAAARTQDNFLSQMPVVSQVKSAVELATGNTEAALEKLFLNNPKMIMDGGTAFTSPELLGSVGGRLVTDVNKQDVKPYGTFDLYVEQ